MKLLFAVIDDLYSFVIDELFRSAGTEKDTITFDARETRDETDFISTGELPVEESPTFRGVGEIFETYVSTPVVDSQEQPPQKNTIMYTGGGETPLFINPTREFDSVVTKLPYGAMVMVLEQRGRWARVVYETHEGWALRDDLVDRAAYVYPQFIVGEQNTAHDPNTMRIRALLEDEFAGAAAEIDLQAAEYVQYRLFRKGITVQWPGTRPRIAGLWHVILKGIPGIHAGVSPKTGAIMEYMHTEEEGHLAYVEAVFPDETINISEVNYPDRGIYNERVLTREEWRELRPIFIQVT